MGLSTDSPPSVASGTGTKSLQQAGGGGAWWPSAGEVIRRVQTAGRRKVVHWANLGFSELAPRDAVRMAYNVLLRRDPDPVAWDHLADAVGDGALSIPGMVDAIRSSNEYRTVPYEALSLHGSLHGSLHASRCEFITGLPPARRIIDLGGGHTTDARGALVVLGYPYRFEELVVVDLPPDERHPLYRSDRFESNRTDRGVVRYEYRSMDDLSFASDASVDLVYSGQSIEHVEVDDADTVLAESFRVLRPGGHLAIDTPNGSVCRLQQEAFIDPAGCRGIASGIA